MDLKKGIRKIREKVKSSKKVFQGEKSIDRTYFTENVFESEEAAKNAFEESKKRLFSIHLWNVIPGPENSTFMLYNKKGSPYSASKPSIDDFIKIEIPGPFPENWVKVVDVKNKDDFAEFTVRPSTDPTDKDQPEEVTEHFFKSKATSTFKVERKGNTIIAYEIGKQEAINKMEPEAGGRSAVNTLISEGGWAAFQELQWKNLTDYLVGKQA